MLADGTFAGTIDNFAAGDAIDLAGIGLATGAIARCQQHADDHGRHAAARSRCSSTPSENYTGQVFRLVSDGNGGTTIKLGNNLNGGSGNNTLTGGAGDDIVNGGNGNDVLNGLAGDDVLDGGNGNER